MMRRARSVPPAPAAPAAAARPLLGVTCTACVPQIPAAASTEIIWHGNRAAPCSIRCVASRTTRVWQHGAWGMTSITHRPRPRPARCTGGGLGDGHSTALAAGRHRPRRGPRDREPAGFGPRHTTARRVVLRHRHVVRVLPPKASNTPTPQPFNSSPRHSVRATSGCAKCGQPQCIPTQRPPPPRTPGRATAVLEREPRHSLPLRRALPQVARDARRIRRRIQDAPQRLQYVQGNNPVSQCSHRIAASQLSSVHERSGGRRAAG